MHAYAFLQVFQALPLGVVIDKKVFVVHGGLFQKDGTALDELAKIDRFREPPEEGPMSDMLWSDPQPFPGRGPSKRGVGELLYLQSGAVNRGAWVRRVLRAFFFCYYGPSSKRGGCVAFFLHSFYNRNV